MVKSKIGNRLLFYFFLAALLPLLMVVFFIINIGKGQITKSAHDRQQVIAEQSRTIIDGFLESRLNSIVFQTQTKSTKNFDKDGVDYSFAALVKDDQNLLKISLVDATGKEKSALDRNGLIKIHDDISNTNPFKSATFLSGKEYISSIEYSDKDIPILTIAIPVIRILGQQNLDNLTTGTFGTYREASDITGVVIAKYDLSSVLKEVLSYNPNTHGHAYIVDDRGNLLAHPDINFLKSHQNINNVHQIREFLAGNTDIHESISETGEHVLSAYSVVSKTKWAVVVEEPISQVTSIVSSYYVSIGEIAIAAIGLALVFSLIFRRQLLTPIRLLATGAKRIGGGDFSYSMPAESKDELGDLARSFNIMGKNVNKLVGDLKTQYFNTNLERLKLSAIISSVSDGVIALNKNGVIISINPPAAKLIDRQTDSLIGKVMTDYYLWVHEGIQFVPNLDNQGITHYSDLVLPHGNDISYLDLVVSVLDKQDSEVAAIITIHDMTPGRELDVMKLDFVAIAAHELRTPLTVVRGYLNLINSDGIRQLSIYNVENLQKAIVGTDQLTILINNLLNISRIERGEMEIIINKIDLQRLTKDVVSQQNTTASLREQDIVFTPSDSKYVYVPGDASSLSEVLNNLIGNALKFTDNGGTVNVNVRTNKDTVRVEIVDKGPGIPLALRSRLFTKFYRVERSLVAGNRGTGLGLFISKTIIELHNGEIGLEPNTDKGSTFYFTLPIFNPEKHSKLISNDKKSAGIHGWIKKNASHS